MTNEIITTLHPEQDPNTNLYPNIKKENIPDGSIDENKLDPNYTNDIDNKITSLNNDVDNINYRIDDLSDGSPRYVNTSTNILSQTTNKGLAVGTDTGHWYYWDGTKYVDGGVYQSSTYFNTGIVLYKNKAIMDFANKKIIFPANGGYLCVFYKSNSYYFNNSTPLTTDYVIDFSSYTKNAGVIVFDTIEKTIKVVTSTNQTSTDILIGAFVLNPNEFYLFGNYDDSDDLENILALDGYVISEKPIIFDFINKKISYEGGNAPILIAYGNSKRVFYNDNTGAVTTFDVDISTQLTSANFLSINYNLVSKTFVLKTITSRTNEDVFLGLIIRGTENIIFNGDFKHYKSNYTNLKNVNEEYIYPKYPVWGSEYLYSWYQKLMNNENVKIVCSGDSTTWNGSTGYTRDALMKKILIKGGYDTSKITSINAGHGSMWTGQWLNGEIYPPDTPQSVPEYGYLNEDMQRNPDIYVLAWGINDGSPIHIQNVDWNERARQFEERYREGLNRIRTNGEYTSGPSYNKSMIDLPIIICTPVSTDSQSGIKNELWQNKIRGIIQRLCREYKCAFFDVSAVQYDHSSYSNWSLNGDKLHPNDLCNMILMSEIKDLLFPILLHKN